MSDKVKKVVGFLVCKDAFTQRNITSIGLVAIFFVVYVLAGGKITTKLPDLRNAGLGPTETGRKRPQEKLAQPELLDLTKSESKKVLGVTDSEARRQRLRSQQTEGSLFTKEERQELEKQPIDREGLVEGVEFTNRREQWRLERSEVKPTDSLNAIEERLQIRRRK